ncbi:MAG: DUF2157 domain-containing protein [Hyphomicrobiaceae bacterium]
MWITQQQMKQNLARWREAGWVTEDGERRIAAEIAARGGRVSFAGALATLGVVLLGFALMSFVGANWQEMSRLARLAVIFAGLLGSYAAAGALWKRGHAVLAEAAVLAGVCAFGAGIMLISQMYHIDGYPPDAVLVWALGAIAAGVLTGSRAALGAAAALLALWTGWETMLSNSAHAALLPFAVVLAGALAAERWQPGLHLVGLLVSFWVVKMGYLHNGELNHVVALIGLAVSAGAGAIIRFAADGREASGPLAHLAGEPAGAALGYGMATAFAGLFGLQFFETIPTSHLTVLAALTLAMLVAAIAFGVTHRRRGAVWLGYIGFSIEIMTLYFRTVGTLLGSSVFFLVAGVIVIALAGLAYRLHRISEPAMGDA